MTYRVYYTNAPLPQGVDQPNIANIIPEEIATEADAIRTAMAALEKGWTVWRIDGPENYLKDKQAVNLIYYQKFGRWPKC